MLISTVEDVRQLRQSAVQQLGLQLLVIKIHRQHCECKQVQLASEDFSVDA